MDEFGVQSVTLLAVRPHPDDESTSTGGMLAYYSARHVRTGVVICTGGEEGEIHDPDLDPVADRSRPLEIRTQEVKDACAILGVAELRMLGVVLSWRVLNADLFIEAHITGDIA